MKKYFLCMVALLSLAIVACESDDTAPAPAVRPTFDLIDAQPDVTSAVVAANIESKGEAPISEVGFSYQEAGGEYVDVVCTNFKDGLARQTYQVKQVVTRVYKGTAIISQRTPDLRRQLLTGRRVNIRNFSIIYTHRFR